MDFLAPIRRMIVACFDEEHDAGVAVGPTTINFSLGQKQTLRLAASTVPITLAEPPGCAHYQLRVVQDESGAREIVFAAPAVHTINGAAPLQPRPDPGAETFYNFFWNGSQWYVAAGWVGATPV